MLNDALAKARQEMQPPWDELRERRVLARVEAERGRIQPQSAGPHAMGSRRRSEGRRRAAWTGLAVAAAVATAAVGWIWGSQDGVEDRTVATDAGGRSRLSLTDGSVAILETGAEVEVETQSMARVVLEQRRGTVRYEVRPAPERPFVVRAGDVEVRVLGTIFSVAVESDGVRVAVERGHVAVVRGDRTLHLRAGEDIRVGAEAVADATSRSEELRPSAEDLSDDTAPTIDGVAAQAPNDRASGRTGWRRSARSPDRAGATTTAEPSAAEPDVEELLSRADRARRRGDTAAAEASLRMVIAEHRGDPRVIAAHFMLGRVEQSAGRHRAAAASFGRCYELSSHGPLAEDALAEQAIALHRAGDHVAAGRAASRYVSRFPSGTHIERVRGILD